MVVSRAGVLLRDDAKELYPEESMQPVPTHMGKPSAHRARVPKHHEDSPFDLATWPWNGPVMERATNLSWWRKAACVPSCCWMDAAMGFLPRHWAICQRYLTAIRRR